MYFVTYQTLSRFQNNKHSDQILSKFVLVLKNCKSENVNQSDGSMLIYNADIFFDSNAREKMS